MGKTLLFCWLLVMPITLVQAQTDTSASITNVEIRVVESTVKRLFGRMWSKLRGYVGRSEQATIAGGRTLIAGVRGAETTDRKSVV